MNFITVGTKQNNNTLDPNNSPEIYTAIAGGLITETGLVLDKNCKLPKKVENSLQNVLVHRDLDNLGRRFIKPIALHLNSQDPSVQSEVMRKMKPRRIASIDTHKKWITKKNNHLTKLKDDINVLFVNQEEARLLSGKKDPMKAAKVLSSGCISVVKLGAQGVIVADDQVHYIPAFPVNVVDDKFAGDAFAGAFTAYLSKRPSLTKAAMYGNVVASFAIEGEGIERLMGTTRNDVKRRYKVYLKNF